MTPEQLAALLPEELEALRVDAVAEQERRRNLDAIPAEIERLDAKYTQAKNASDPAWPELRKAIDARRARMGK